MKTAPLVIWCNQEFSEPALSLLRKGIGDHQLILAAQRSASVLTAGAPDPALAEADIAFGQPDPQSVANSARVKWIHLTTAGYTKYDTADFRKHVIDHGIRLSNSSQVYAEPCAEHVFAFMLAHARQLPWALNLQRTDHSWPSLAIRAESRLLRHQSVLLLGYGAIARRLVELMAPLHMEIHVLRRSPGKAGEARTVSLDQLPAVLREVNHVLNILPDNPATRGFMDAPRFESMKDGALFYNIGRGTTVDQPALIDSLRSGRLRAAYLDVTDPEPLPPDHPLWDAPNCVISPHTAGGFAGEQEALVRHFLRNHERFCAGEGLEDLVI